jgi:hypothetical protein
MSQQQLALTTTGSKPPAKTIEVHWLYEYVGKDGKQRQLKVKKDEFAGAIHVAGTKMDIFRAAFKKDEPDMCFWQNLVVYKFEDTSHEMKSHSLSDFRYDQTYDLSYLTIPDDLVTELMQTDPAILDENVFNAKQRCSCLRAIKNELLECRYLGTEFRTGPNGCVKVLTANFNIVVNALERTVFSVTSRALNPIAH